MGKQLQSRTFVSCIKTLLMAFNVLFWILGAIVLAAGIIVKVEIYRYMEVKQEFSETAPYVLVATGGFMLLLGLLACCCTAKGQPVLLYIYAAFLLVILVILVGSGVSTWAYREHLKEGFQDGLTGALTQYHLIPSVASAVDTLQSWLSCCGISNATDWLAMPYGQKNEPPYPLSCCHGQRENICITLHRQGCFNTVLQFFDMHKNILLIVCISVAGFQFVGVILACCLARSLHKAKYEHV